MALLFSQFLNGLQTGSIYALVALGLTLVYGILHIPNFSHGALFMAGAYVAFFFVGSLIQVWALIRSVRATWRLPISSSMRFLLEAGKYFSQ